MNAKHAKSGTVWVDPDDAPEWTDAMLDRAELADGGKVLRPAGGTVSRGRGRPPVEQPKERVTIRLDADLLNRIRSTGRGWQTRMQEVLEREFGGK